ncbi:MAG TPA: hypothetical protein VN025_17525 [Candidatus Dormibacteraeota bacterium]|jgi:hypothetical protein|nr:hypothetical protein [Candidatus Dormibacteraeota bacterium]
MSFLGTKLGRVYARRAMALLACAALFYFAAGGAFLHEHKGGNDTACHICQALHMPALAPAGIAAIAIPESVSWYLTQPIHAAPCEAFSFHHAGRAPPVA